jgi:hypothetical protein
MTLSIDGTDIGAIVQVASIVGSIVGMLIVTLIVYLMVRPPRHIRERRKAERRGEIGIEVDPIEAEELARTVDRMESRLAVLERALADQIERPAIGGCGQEQDLAPAQDGRESGRKQ